MARFASHPRLALLAVFVAAQAVLLIGLGEPNKLMFDETHYVPAARMIFGLHGPANEEHPLLGKWLIGLSMWLFGDDPAGWRTLSTTAGAGTIAAVFWIGQRLFGSLRAGIVAAILTMLDQMVWVQARIAMLDVFMGAFLFAGAALALEGATAARPARWLVGAGFCLGLAIGCKWAAIPPAAGIVLGMAAARLANPGRPADRLALAGGSLLLTAACAAIAYLATFTPAFFYADRPLSPWHLLAEQGHLYTLQTATLAPHPNASPWWSWPLVREPIWYLYEPIAGIRRGVLFVGNPAILWGGLLAVAGCAWLGWRDRRRALLVAAGGWAWCFGSWALVPKRIGFLYYYYVPAILLGLALAGLFDHLRRRGGSAWPEALFVVVSAMLFVYFLPIISATPLAGGPSFNHWMWFDRWR